MLSPKIALLAASALFGGQPATAPHGAQFMPSGRRTDKRDTEPGYYKQGANTVCVRFWRGGIKPLCRGAVRARARRIAAAYRKLASAKSKHGRIMAKRDVQLAERP